MTATSARGESSVRRRMSHPRVIICIFIARKETNEPANIQRKSRYFRESKIG